MKNELLFDSICNKYNLSILDKEYLIKIVYPIINDDNFLRRTTSEFPHHGSITLGEHIIEDVVVTYLMSKKEIKKRENYRMDLAINIALLHDLYTIPWQNNRDAKVKHFFDKHGFRHPIEAVINSITWYPYLFQNDIDSMILIDGILHHMFPLPVRYLNNLTELKNKELLNNLDDKYKKMIDTSLKRKRIGSISFTRSSYMEGRVMSKADRKVSRKQIKDFSSFKALLTGHNKNLKNK